MKNPRLIYRVILKVLTAIALIILLVVFLSSLFVSTEKEVKTQSNTSSGEIVSLSLMDLKSGEIKKALWNGREVAVLYRKKVPVTIESSIRQPSTAKPHQSINFVTRSQKPDFFVYINFGDSRNCPLFYSKSRFKDICSSTYFDNTGRQENNPQQGYHLEIPPHHFKGNELIIGSWE